MVDVGNQEDPDSKGLAPTTRRQLLGYAASSAFAGLFALKPSPAAAGLADMLGSHYLSFFNVNTSERLTVPYAGGGKVVSGAMPAVRQLLHDHHDGSHHDIDPKLFEVLFSIMRLLGGGAGSTIQVTSGYRSPHTNAMLRLNYDGVAANSYHMRGQAIDFWIPGVPLDALHRAALSVRGGGVGYYPAHHFIHVDVGPVRQWGSMGGGGGFAFPHISNQYVLNGHTMRLTPIQARTLAMHRRALLWDRTRRKVLGR